MIDDYIQSNVNENGHKRCAISTVKLDFEAKRYVETSLNTKPKESSYEDN